MLTHSLALPQYDCTCVHDRDEKDEVHIRREMAVEVKI
jgi:hypothetical protein